jgi:hypothetical protein
MPNDDDILSQLEEIDVGQIMGEEIPLDESLEESLDLDFEDEGVPLKPKAAAQGTKLAGSEIRVGAPTPPAKFRHAEPKAAGQAKVAEPGPSPRKTKAPPPRAEPKAAPPLMPPPPQVAAPRPPFSAQACQGAPASAEVPEATATVQEMVLHAKTLRIVADTVVIEPKSVSISS